MKDNETFEYETDDFESELTGELELGADAAELEEERSRSARFRSSNAARRGFRPRPRPRIPARPRGGWTAGPPRLPRHPHPKWPPRRPHRWPVRVEPFPYPSAGVGTEHVRWIQDCLNRILSARLPVDGVMNPTTRSVVRSFQRREKLPITGIVGPDTEDALRRACSSAPASADDNQADSEAAFTSELETEEEGLGDIFGRITSGIGTAYGQVADVLGGATGSRIVDLTAQADKSVEKGTRDPKSVYALVLHQMACCFNPTNPLRRFLKLKAHFAILADGRILQLHPTSALIWASNGFNRCSVAVEFAGNFPSVTGKWWKGETYGKNRVTQAQIEAGRYLVRYLIRTMGLTRVLAHRQSSATRGNDPGPDIWYGVGQWAVENLGLRDGGQGFKIGTGKPIPNAWRNWGRSGASREITFAAEAELDTESDAELWQGRSEGPAELEVSLAAAIGDPKANGPGIYTLYKEGRRFYVGKSDQLGRRLRQHLWCLQHMAVDTSKYAVKLTPMRGATPSQLQRVESALIAKWGRQRQGGRLTNVKTRELEAELWGEAWH